MSLVNQVSRAIYLTKMLCVLLLYAFCPVWLVPDSEGIDGAGISGFQSHLSYQEDTCLTSLILLFRLARPRHWRDRWRWKFRFPELFIWLRCFVSYFSRSSFPSGQPKTLKGLMALEIQVSRAIYLTKEATCLTSLILLCCLASPRQQRDRLRLNDCLCLTYFCRSSVLSGQPQTAKG